uniref:Acidic phospholipase A2 n=1 Tax=Atheris nitschei TaxID=110224 RepID=A0A140YIG5_ATHNI|nr:acidic phospholipase A2 [Atheris nitschei]
MRTLWIVALWLMGVEGNLFQFGSMIKKKTGKNAIMNYSAYGCYCGWGGQGKPQDATDRCCFVHDCCYGEVVNGCNPKVILYNYSFQGEDIVCGDEDPCKKKVCECDRVAATCFGENVNTYNDNYRWYPSKNCKEESEQC